MDCVTFQIHFYKLEMPAYLTAEMSHKIKIEITVQISSEHWIRSHRGNTFSTHNHVVLGILLLLLLLLDEGSHFHEGSHRGPLGAQALETFHHDLVLRLDVGRIWIRHNAALRRTRKCFKIKSFRSSFPKQYQTNSANKALQCTRSKIQQRMECLPWRSRVLSPLWHRSSRRFRCRHTRRSRGR